MKIALFSDIHANLPALEAALADMDSRKPDAVYSLGDWVGYNIWPNEVVELIQRRNIATLAGNHDLKVPKPGSDSEAEKSGKNYAYSIVGNAFILFRYDVEKAAKAVEESPLPNEFAHMLRKGY